MLGYNEPAEQEDFEDLEEMRAYALRLIGAWDRKGPDHFLMTAKFARTAGPLVWSLSNHTVELVRTVVDLSALDRMLVAVPLIRLAMDCAMTSAWILVDEGAAGAVVYEGIRQRKAALATMVEVGSPGFDESDLQLAADELARLKEFKLSAGGVLEQRMRGLDGGTQVYSIYRIASSLSHAGVSLADQYLTAVEPTDDAPLNVAFARDQVIPGHEAWLGTALSMLVLALETTNHISAEGLFSSEIAEAHERVGGIVEIRPAQ